MSWHSLTISSGVLNLIKPVFPCHGYGFFGGTKVCTLTRTPGKPVAKPVTIPNINYIISLIEARPKIFLDEVQENLRHHCSREVSLSTLSHTLHRIQITHKKVTTEALERNELLRATWQAEYGDIGWMNQVSTTWSINIDLDGASWEWHVFHAILSSVVNVFQSYQHWDQMVSLRLTFLKDQSIKNTLFSF